jgi:hypothetical protein
MRTQQQRQGQHQTKWCALEQPDAHHTQTHTRPLKQLCVTHVRWDEHRTTPWRAHMLQRPMARSVTRHHGPQQLGAVDVQQVEALQRAGLLVLAARRWVAVDGSAEEVDDQPDEATRAGRRGGHSPRRARSDNHVSTLTRRDGRGRKQVSPTTAAGNQQHTRPQATGEHRSHSGHEMSLEGQRVCTTRTNAERRTRGRGQ